MPRNVPRSTLLEALVLPHRHQKGTKDDGSKDNNKSSRQCTYKGVRYFFQLELDDSIQSMKLYHHKKRTTWSSKDVRIIDRHVIFRRNKAYFVPQLSLVKFYPGSVTDLWQPVSKRQRVWRERRFSGHYYYRLGETYPTSSFTLTDGWAPRSLWFSLHVKRWGT